MKRQANTFGSLTLSALLLGGCSFSSAKPATAVQNAHIITDPSEQRALGLPVQNVALKTFAPTDVSLTGKTNLFVFWQLKNGQVDPADIEAVLNLSTKVQADEDEQYPLATQNRDLVANVFTGPGIDPTVLQSDENTVTAAQDPNAAAFLQAINDSTVDAADGLKALAAEEASIPTLLTNLNQTNAADKAADDQITADTAKISQDAAAIQAEQAKPTPDPTVIQNLKNDEAAMRKQIAADRGIAGYSAYKSAQEAIQAEAAALPAFGQILTPDLKPQFDLWLKNSLRLTAITIEVSNYLTQIIGNGRPGDKDYVPGHVMPVIGSNSPELYIHFEPSGQIDMKIDQWFPPVGWEQPDGSDDTRDAPIFSTDDGSIRDVSYTPLGGEYQFTVVTRWASYVFKIARSRYDAADAAANPPIQHYQGEINLYSDDASQLMRGSAVLDQNSDLE